MAQGVNATPGLTRGQPWTPRELGSVSKGKDACPPHASRLLSHLELHLVSGALCQRKGQPALPHLWPSGWAGEALQGWGIPALLT